MGIQLKKFKKGRERFVKSVSLVDLNNWPAHLYVLKKTLAEQTNLQLVGTKIYWEMSPQGIALLLKVIGVPFDATIPLNFGLSLQDFNQRDVLVHTLEGVTLFNLDFLTFLAQAQAIHLAIMKNQDRISSIFHIVFDNEKIELHFFEQKDYIQNLL